MKKSNESLFRNIRTVTAFDLVSKATNFLLIILLIRVLSVEDYALFTLFIAISSALNGAISNGLNLSYIRYDVEEYSRNKNYSSLYIVNLIVKIVLLVVIAIGYLFLKNHFIVIPENFQIVFYYAILYGLSLTMLGTISSYFQVREKYIHNGIILNVKNLLLFISCVIIYFLFNFNFKVVTLIYIFITGFSLPVLLYIIIKNRFKSVSRLTIIDFFKTSSWLLIYSIFISLLSQIDIFIVSIYLTSVEISNFGVAFRYYGVLLSILPSIAMVLRIRTSKKDLIDNEVEQRKFILDWIKITSKTIIPLIVLCIIIVPLFWTTLNGFAYNDAILPFQILSIGVAISYIFSPNIAIIMAMKKYKLLCLVTFIALGLNIIGDIVIVGYLGIVGISMITILAHAFLNISIVIYLLKRLPKNK